MATRRQYITEADAEAIIGQSVTEAQIEKAEEMIDSFVGAQDKFFPRVDTGVATAADTTSLTDTSQDSPLKSSHDGYFVGCEILIIAGTGAGQRRTVSEYSEASQKVTVSAAWTTTPDTTSAFKIYQLGKFPRRTDVFYDNDTAKYYRSIPEMVRSAVAAQLAFMLEKGDAFFDGEQGAFTKEQIGDYSYEIGSGSGGSVSAIGRLISPRAKGLLKGITNRTGRILY